MDFETYFSSQLAPKTVSVYVLGVGLGGVIVLRGLVGLGDASLPGGVVGLWQEGKQAKNVDWASR